MSASAGAVREQPVTEKQWPDAIFTGGEFRPPAASGTIGVRQGHR
jgi:hypothetical protein